MSTPSRFAQVEWIAKSDEIQVRINTLAAGQSTPWHFHTAVTDNVFCLESELEIGLKDPDQTVTLRPGERLEIPARRIHRVLNRSGHELRYLLIQATGPYDFNVVPGDNDPA
jgi:quercetin dioxygenase-like cupin family protein